MLTHTYYWLAFKNSTLAQLAGPLVTWNCNAFIIVWWEINVDPPSHTSLPLNHPPLLPCAPLTGLPPHDPLPLLFFPLQPLVDSSRLLHCLGTLPTSLTLITPPPTHTHCTSLPITGDHVMSHMTARLFTLFSPLVFHFTDIRSTECSASWTLIYLYLFSPVFMRCELGAFCGTASVRSGADRDVSPNAEVETEVRLRFRFRFGIKPVHPKLAGRKALCFQIVR